MPPWRCQAEHPGWCWPRRGVCTGELPPALQSGSARVSGDGQVGRALQRLRAESGQQPAHRHDPLLITQPKKQKGP